MPPMFENPFHEVRLKEYARLIKGILNNPDADHQNPLLNSLTELDPDEPGYCELVDNLQENFGEAMGQLFQGSAGRCETDLTRDGASVLESMRGLYKALSGVEGGLNACVGEANSATGQALALNSEVGAPSSDVLHLSIYAGFGVAVMVLLILFLRKIIK